MQVLFLAYSNSQSSPLASLLAEDDSVFKTLSSRALQQHFFIHRDSYTSIAKIAEYLTIYRDKIFLFSYSGHAGRDELHLDQETARAEGIAHLMGQCVENGSLKLVLLNGCSTQGQVEQLLDQGVPVVIATSAPVDDNKASNFGIRFFQALNEQATIGQAFELALGQALSEQSLAVHRGDVRSAQFEGVETTEAGPGVWGIFYREENEAVLEEKLPSQPVQPVAEDFTPNELLIQALMDALADYNDEIEFYAFQEHKGKTVSLPKKRMAVLNALPAPIAEHLRKLVVPVAQEAQGFDKVSMVRLEQLYMTFQVSVQLLTYIMLAQLWEAFVSEKQIKLPRETRDDLMAFLRLAPEDRSSFNFIVFLRGVQGVLAQEEIDYFAPEIESLSALFVENEPFQNACLFFQILTQRLVSQQIEPQEVAEMCIRGEENLAIFFGELGFLGKYTLAAVDSIDVKRFRHMAKPTFRHSVVKLLDLLGGLAEEDIELDQFMSNQSVLLLKQEDNEIKEHLNLSPFVIDENAFERKTDVTKIHFYTHYDTAEDAYCYRYINKPSDPILKTSDTNYQVVQQQFEAFQKMISDAESV